MEIKYLINNEIITINSSNEDLQILINGNNVSIVCLKRLKLLSAYIEFNHTYDNDDLIFVNGYQSWTDSKELTITERLKNVMKLPSFLINKFAFDKYGDAYFYKYKKDVLHGFDISYIKGKNELFIANKNKDAYLIIEHFVKENKIVLNSDINNLTLNPKDEITLFDYVIGDDYENSKNEYLSLYNPTVNKKIFGYTSWYNHYQNINEEKIKDNLKALDERFNLFQIDDGYETFVGDWLEIDKNKFPNGLKNIVDEIHNKGLMAGIWLAPFVAETNSSLFKNHPEYFKKDNEGNFIKCGSNWSGFYVLDIENTLVKEYIEKCLKYYIDLGFDFFKLDFLYAVNVPNYDGKSRCQVANEAYGLLRYILKDKLILGCGATLINSFSSFDYLRIGPDVSLIFDDVWFMKFMHRERISTKVTIQNTIYRSIFNNHMFLNDPDVFLLRDDNISLSDKQKEALLIINSLFGGVLMTSDNINNYDEKKKELLNLALKLNNSAKVVSYKKEKNTIKIKYELESIIKTLVYDVKKGIIING